MMYTNSRITDCRSAILCHTIRSYMVDLTISYPSSRIREVLSAIWTPLERRWMNAVKDNGQ